MSKYTTEVRYICETLAGRSESAGLNSVAEIIEAARPVIFNFDFPIFDENYRSVLETKILKHYYTREIGEETVGLWRLRLDTRLNEIMPYYNKLYNSELIEFNPLYDVDVTTTYTKQDDGSQNGRTNDTGAETFTGTDTGNNTHTATNNSEDWRLFNDTPQGGIDGIEAEVNAFNYLTDATKETHEDETNDTLTSTLQKTSTKNNTFARTDTKTLTNLQEYEEHVTGHRSGITMSKALTEFRETFINIDRMIIDDLSDLFMNLW